MNNDVWNHWSVRRRQSRGRSFASARRRAATSWAGFADRCRTDREFAFGHTLLSIIGTSPIQQPITSKDQAITLTYNGEVYNYVELLEDDEALQSRCSGSSDTEVLVEGLSLYGIDFVDRLNGIFAFAVFDRRTRDRLFGSRSSLVSSRCTTPVLETYCFLLLSYVRCFIIRVFPSEPDVRSILLVCTISISTWRTHLCQNRAHGRTRILPANSEVEPYAPPGIGTIDVPTPFSRNLRNGTRRDP